MQCILMQISISLQTCCHIDYLLNCTQFYVDYVEGGRMCVSFLSKFQKGLTTANNSHTHIHTHLFVTWIMVLKWKTIVLLLIPLLEYDT